MKLVEKTGFRMRKAGYNCRGIHIALLYKDGAHWHRGVTLKQPLYHSRDIYDIAFKIMCQSPYRKPVANLAESVFDLQNDTEVRQLSLFGDSEKKHRLVQAIDGIKMKYGESIITPALMLGTKDLVPDRISFGNVRELEENILES